MDRTGKCLCGAITFTAKDVSDEAAACHCGMCRRWAGGPWIGVHVGGVEWQGDEPSVVTSSAWAERGFCSKCGTSLFYRLTAEGKYQGMTSISLGAFEDQSNLTLTKEWFIDNKPEVYALAGERKRVTEAEVMAMFGAS